MTFYLQLTTNCNFMFIIHNQNLFECKKNIAANNFSPIQILDAVTKIARVFLVHSGNIMTQNFYHQTLDISTVQFKGGGGVFKNKWKRPRVIFSERLLYTLSSFDSWSKVICHLIIWGHMKIEYTIRGLSLMGAIQSKS